MPVAAVRPVSCHHHCTASEREFPFPDHPTKTIADASVAVWRPMFELFVGTYSLIVRITEMVKSWSLGPLVQALRGLRGIDMLSAATLVATSRSFRIASAPDGVSGPGSSEYSSGSNIRRGGITKVGNREARRMLIEAAWSYRYPARIAQDKAEILARLPGNGPRDEEDMA